MDFVCIYDVDGDLNFTINYPLILLWAFTLFIKLKIATIVINNCFHKKKQER